MSDYNYPESDYEYDYPDNLGFRDTECCAIQEIVGLSAYNHNPLGAMVSFCKQNLQSGQVTFYSGSAYEDTLYSFYLFTSGVYEEDPMNPDGTPDTYATQFAKFIKDNNLGEVWSSPVLVNYAYHPENSNQVFVWMPKVENIRKWYDKYLKKNKKEK